MYVSYRFFADTADTLQLAKHRNTFFLSFVVADSY